MSPNNGILLNGILRPKIFNIPLGSCSFINLDFLLLHTADSDNNIVVQFLVVNSFKSTFPVVVGFFCTSNMSTCFIIACV